MGRRNDALPRRRAPARRRRAPALQGHDRRHLPSLVAVFLNYLKRGDVNGTWLESHFRWQIRTFWFTFLWLVVYGLLIITLIGIPIAWILIALLGLWVGYRVIRGWLALFREQPVG